MARAAALQYEMTELMVASVLTLPTPVIRDLIHRLIDHLDQIEGNSDFEDDGCGEDTDEREPQECE